MAVAPTTRAEFLKSADRFATAESAPLAARWGERAPDTQQPSALATEAAAIAEAARQLALMGQPLADDEAEIVGIHRNLRGRTIEIEYAGRLGIGATAAFLVVSSSVDDKAGVTTVKGFVRL